MLVLAALHPRGRAALHVLGPDLAPVGGQHRAIGLLERLVHRPPGVLVRAPVDVPEELVEGGVPLELLVLLLLLQLLLQLVPVLLLGVGGREHILRHGTTSTRVRAAVGPRRKTCSHPTTTRSGGGRMACVAAPRRARRGWACGRVSGGWEVGQGGGAPILRVVEGLRHLPALVGVQVRPLDGLCLLHLNLHLGPENHRLALRRGHPSQRRSRPQGRQRAREEGPPTPLPWTFFPNPKSSLPAWMTHWEPGSRQTSVEPQLQGLYATRVSIWQP
mmetsp:Transcript_65101/g.205774  ORF Transcript_65101/g.205774 Transcript_65101/m.205774 type:complete len:274 (-) Transcript_65101:283-1104(-)